MRSGSRKPTPSARRDGYAGRQRPPAYALRRGVWFKKGQSGNPRGRPKGSKTKRKDFAPGDLHKIILAEAYRDVPLREGGRTLTLPVAQAVMRSIAVNAAKGQSRAQALFAQIVSTAEAAERRRDFEYLEAAFRYKTEWTRILEDRARRGVSGPEPLPHPDDIIIDHRRGDDR